MKNRRSAVFFAFIIVCFTPIIVYQRKISLILYASSTMGIEARYDDGLVGTDEPERVPTTTDDDARSSRNNNTNNGICTGNEDGRIGGRRRKRTRRRREYDLPPFESIFQIPPKSNNNTSSRRKPSYFHADVGVRKFISPQIDVSDTLQYAIVGFPKAGTTAMRKALSHISLITGGDYCPSRGEEVVYDMYLYQGIWKRAIEKSFVSTKIPKLAKILEVEEGYGNNSTKNDHLDDDLVGEEEEKNTQIVIRGIKCPRGLDTLSMLRYYVQNFPTTKLLVGIRHPVTWFESFYNFRVQNFGKRENPYDLTQSCIPDDDTLAHADTTSRNTTTTVTTTNATNARTTSKPPVSSYYYRSVTGNARKCRSQSCPNDQLLCVDRARFHLFLSQLGKVPYDDDWNIVAASRSSATTTNNFDNQTLKTFFNVLPSNRYMYETFRSRNPIFLYTMEQMSLTFTFDVPLTNSSTQRSTSTITNAAVAAAEATNTRKRRVEQFWTDISNFVNDDYDNDGDGCEEEDDDNNGQSSSTTNNKAKHYKFMIPTQNDEEDEDENNADNNITSSTFHVKPGKKLTDEQQRERDRHKIDICDEQFENLRIQLMKYSWQMSHYICDYFIPYGSRDRQVYVSNRDYLCNTILFKYYQHDPCGRLTRVDDTGTYAVI